MGACLSCLAIDLCSACLCCSCKLIGSSLPQSARFQHFAILFIIFLFAIILGEYYPDKFSSKYSRIAALHIDENCNAHYLNDCIYRQMIYRASLASFILFTFLSFLATADYLNKNLMGLKFLLGIGIFIALWWVDADAIKNWVEFSRAFSIFWLLVQGLLMLDFSYDCHDVLINLTKTDDEGYNRGIYVIYTLISLAALVAVIVGLAYLFQSYTGCELGQFYTILTLLVGVLCTAISLLNVVNKGMLTPMLMFAYSVFMCWYALSSNPLEPCNPEATSNTSKGKTTNVVIVCIITLGMVGYVVANGSATLNIFNPNAEGVLQSATNKSAKLSSYQSVLAQPGTTPAPAQGGVVAPATATNETPAGGAASGEEEDSSGTLHERVLFCVIMAFLSCYGAMILTNWGNSDGQPDAYGPRDIANESMWIKIVTQWVFMLMQFKALHAAYTENASGTNV